MKALAMPDSSKFSSVTVATATPIIIGKRDRYTLKIKVASNKIQTLTYGSILNL